MGSARAASIAVTLSSDRNSIPGLAMACASVVFPDCRGPVISTTRVSERLSRSFASTCLR